MPKANQNRKADSTRQNFGKHQRRFRPNRNRSARYTASSKAFGQALPSQHAQKSWALRSDQEQCLGTISQHPRQPRRANLPRDAYITSSQRANLWNYYSTQSPDCQGQTRLLRHANLLEKRQPSATEKAYQWSGEECERIHRRLVCQLRRQRSDHVQRPLHQPSNC